MNILNMYVLQYILCAYTFLLSNSYCQLVPSLRRMAIVTIASFFDMLSGLKEMGMSRVDLGPISMSSVCLMRRENGDVVSSSSIRSDSVVFVSTEDKHRLCDIWLPGGAVMGDVSVIRLVVKTAVW